MGFFKLRLSGNLSPLHSAGTRSRRRAAMATHDIEAHRALFEQGMTAKIRTQSGANSRFLTEDEHDDLVSILDGWEARPPAQRSLMKPAYHAAKKYEVVKVGEENVLMVRAQPDEAGDLPALDQRLRVLHAANVFDNLLAVHIEGGHCKANTFTNRVSVAPCPHPVRYQPRTNPNARLQYDTFCYFL